MAESEERLDRAERLADLGRERAPAFRDRSPGERAAAARASNGDPAALVEQGFSGAELELHTQQLVETQLLLERSRDRYADLYDFAPLAYLTLDPNGVVEEINLTGSDLLGRPRERIQGTPFLVFVAPPMRPAFLEHMRLTRAGQGVVSTELQLQTGGADLPVELYSRPARSSDDGRLHFRAALIDLSERKRTERDRERLLAELANERRQLQEVLRQMPSGVLIIEAQHQRLVFANPKCEEILRVRFAGPLTYESFRRWRTFRLDGSECVYEDLPFVRALKSGEMVGAESLELRHFDGQRQFLSVNAAAIRDEGGAIVAAVAAFEDVTARTHAEEALKRLNERLEQHVEERTRYLALLLDVALIANASDSAEQALEKTLERVCERMGWPIGHAWVRLGDAQDMTDSGLWWHAGGELYASFTDISARLRFAPGEGLIGRVALAGRPLWVGDLAREPDFRRSDEALAAGLLSGVALPIVLHGEVQGMLEFFQRERTEPDETLLAVMSQIGAQLGHVFERKALEKQVAEVVEHEQRRIGIELHDSLGQQLTGAAMLASSLCRRLQAAGSPDVERVELLSRTVDEARAQSRVLAKGLAPVELDAAGLMSALEQLARGTEALCGVRCTFECEEPVPVHDGLTATHLYRIAQEAVNNAVRHGAPSEIVLRLERHRGRERLSVRDDGTGFQGDSAGVQGSGLRIMRYRAGLIGARLEIDSSGEGALVCCTLERHAARRPGAGEPPADAALAGEPPAGETEADGRARGQVPASSG